MNRIHFFILASAAALAGACASASEPDVGLGRAALTVDPPPVTIRTVAAPPTMYEGFEYGIHVEYTATQDFDVVAMVSEGDRIYAIARTTFAAGENSGRVPLRVGSLPPPSPPATLTVRAFPAGSTESPLYESSRPVVTKAPMPIPGPLHYGGELLAFEDTFYRTYSHHDGVTLRIGPCEAPFSSDAPCITSFWSGYGSFERRALDLRTGVLFRDQGNYGTPGSPTTVPAPVTPADRDVYMATLLELESRVKHVATPGFGTMAVTEHPEVQPSLVYVDGVLRGLYRRLGDYLDVHRAPDAVERIIVGQRHAPSIGYGIPEDRDVWIDLFVNDQWITGSRHSVAAGQGVLATYPGFEIPLGTPAPASGRVYVKLVPKGGDWRDAVAEKAYDVAVHGPEYVAYWSSRNAAGGSSGFPAGGRAVVEGRAVAADTRDVRVDVFGPGALWLTGTQVTTEPDSAGYRFSAELAVPPSLRPGDEATIVVKLLPRGAPWPSYVDQDVRTVTVD